MRSRYFFKKISIIMLLSLCFCGAVAQPSVVQLLDPDLYNGKIYAFSSHTIKGHQFLMGEAYVAGTVTISGDEFRGVQLNYDIYNQEVLVLLEVQGTRRSISFPLALVNEFSLLGRTFIIQVQEMEARIYEQLGSGKTQFLRAWQKNTKVSSQSSVYPYYFSKPEHSTFLVQESGQLPLKRNKDLANLYEGDARYELFWFMRKNRIRIGRANNFQMEVLSDFMNEHGY